MQKIRVCMQTTQSGQKSYVDLRRKDLGFVTDDKVFLKVAPMKGILRFGRKGKLSLRFVRPFEVLEQIGPVAYRLALPPALSSFHNVFHASMLKKYVTNPFYIVNFEPFQLNDKLSYEEKPVEILATKVKTLHHREITFVKVLWQNRQFKEATWEREDEMRIQYPELFQQ
ncbi:uncharacterized protein LOC120076502 [Benincasa hispida]|uniref:uncharacterized protein LOC120076502 n=1 Tax=Benincasa hispida TaxID=102211 RepID=UPI0019005114|nr:uncharacterized protein LOC120076502 [Benincasa hispida]